MKAWSARHLGLCLAVSAGLAFSGQIASADQVAATFDTIVTAGTLYNCNGVPGATCPEDNTGTAIYSTAANYLQWGAIDGDPVGTADTYSSITFAAANISVPTVGTSELIGSLTYLNGTSSVETDIFGANLNMSVDGFASTFDVIISTTQNQFSGTDLNEQQLEEDADYINICGPNSQICGTKIEAFEDSEGGTGFTVNLCGEFCANGEINLVQVCGASGSGNAVPEPASSGILGAGLAALAGVAGAGALRRRRKSNDIV